MATARLLFTSASGKEDTARLDVGDHVVGRTTFGIKDAKVSRRQLLFRLTADGRVSVKRGSKTNPSYITRDPSNPDERLPVLDTFVELHDHDQVQLLLNRHFITVRVPKRRPKAKPQAAARRHTKAAPAARQTAPKARSPAAAAAPLTRKPKEPAAVQQKPKCKYGRNCYRTNEVHRAEFWHPPAEDAGSAKRKRASLSDDDDDDDDLSNSGTGDLGGSSKFDVGSPDSSSLGVRRPVKQRRTGSGPPSAAKLWFATAQGGSASTSQGATKPVEDPFSPGGAASSAPSAPSFSNDTQDLDVGSQLAVGATATSADAAMPSKAKAHATTGNGGGGGDGDDDDDDEVMLPPLVSGAAPDGDEQKREEGDGSKAAEKKAPRRRQEGWATVVVPLLAVGPEFKYPEAGSAQIGLERAIHFLQRHDSVKELRVVFVDRARSKGAAALTQAQAARDDAGDDIDAGGRLSIVSGDISNPLAMGVHCSAIVNRCNWRFVSRGADPVNRAIHAAAGSNLQKLSTSKHGTAKPGRAYTVELPPDVSLRRVDNVRWIIHALGPNMNPVRPDDMSNQPEKAAELLKTTYDRVFAEFWEAVGGDAAPAASATTGRASQTKNPFTIAAGKAQPTKPKAVAGAPRRARASRHLDLSDYALHPDRFADSIVSQNAHCVVIRDKYPKARHHLLVIPKPSFLDVKTVSHLRAEHLRKIKKLHQYARDAVKTIRDKHADETPDEKLAAIKIGYHALPSMRPLHIHIISQDFDSPALKTKKHYLSFSTSFFIADDKVERALEWDGSVHVDRDVQALKLKGDLICHRCGTKQRNMPTLKRHLANCR